MNTMKKTSFELRKLSEDTLAELALTEALRSKTKHWCENRSKRLSASAIDEGVQLGANKRCSPHHRCGYLTCPICRYREQLLTVTKHSQPLYNFKRQSSRRYAFEAITLIPPFGRFPTSEGLEGDALTFRNKLQRKIGDILEEGALFCAIDVSLNICTDIGEENHWQVHIHGVAMGLSEIEKTRLKRALKGKHGSALRPLLIKDLINPAGQLAYMAKPNFVKRYSIKGGRRNTRDAPLSILEELELAKWFSPLKAKQRLFRVGNIDHLRCINSRKNV